MPFESLFPTPLFVSGVFVFGLLIGSFLNVVIFRLPVRLHHDWECQCRELLEIGDSAQGTPPGLVKPRSRCPLCGHEISALENIPVISFLVLRGKCSSCKTRIPVRYPLVELLTGLLFLAIALQFGPSSQSIAAAVFSAFLISLTFIDLDHQLLPDVLTLPLMWIGLLLSVFGVFTDPVSSIIGAISGYCILWSIYQFFRLLTGKEGMGYGDFKLLAAIGAWLGWQALPMIVLLSSLIGASVGLTLIALRRHQPSRPLPFGPFLAAAGLVSLLWGNHLIAAYWRLSGITG